jgi:phosphate transport system protein
VIFEIIDRVDKGLRLKAIKKELEASDIRVTEVEKGKIQEPNQEIALYIEPAIDNKKRLGDLKDNVLSLSRMVEKAATLSIKALTRFDTNLTRQVIENDKQIDKKEFEVRQECMNILSAGNLSSDDLHALISVLGIITELERMGDYAAGIANIALMIGEKPPSKFIADIPLMTKRSIVMLREAMISFLKIDVEKAKNIFKMDDDIDKLYDNTFRKLVFAMIDNPDNITQATRLVWVSHNIERFADRVTNICEWIVYGITGELAEIGASNY